MTLRNIFDDLMALLAIHNVDASPVRTREQVLNAIIAAVQIVQSAGEDYWLKEDQVLTLTNANGTTYTLADDTQTVLEPVFLISSGIETPLVHVTSERQFNHYQFLFLGTEFRTFSEGIPQAYWVDSRKNAEDNFISISIKITPRPELGKSYQLRVPTVKSAGKWTLDELCGTSPTIPVPHQYHQSILLPIARMQITTLDLFARHADKLPRLEAEYTRALEQLGIVDPRRPKPQEAK